MYLYKNLRFSVLANYKEAQNKKLICRRRKIYKIKINLKNKINQQKINNKIEMNDSRLM